MRRSVKLDLMGACIVLSSAASAAPGLAQAACAEDDPNCVVPGDPEAWTPAEVAGLYPTLLGIVGSTCEEAWEEGVHVLHCRYHLRGEHLLLGEPPHAVDTAWQPDERRARWRLLYTQVEGQDPEPVYTTAGRAAFGLPDIGPVAPRGPLLQPDAPYIGDISGRVRQHPDAPELVQARVCNGSFFWGAEDLSFVVIFQHRDPETQTATVVAQVPSHLDNVPPKECATIDEAIPAEADVATIGLDMSWRWVRQDPPSDFLP